MTARRAHSSMPGTNVAQKRGLNREISRQVGMLCPVAAQSRGAIESVRQRTRRTMLDCGHVAPENRKSQAVFQCVACDAGP